MIYYWEEAIPLGTLKTDPEVWSLAITEGLITRCQVFFPWGCANLAHVQVLHGTNQLYPFTRGEWLGGNDIRHEFTDRVPITTVPHFLTIQGYNESEKWPHTPWVAVQIIRPRVLPALEQLLHALTGG